MVRKKIVFLGSKPIGYRCLEHLLQVKDELNIEVAGILTQVRKEFWGDNDLSALAQQHAVPVLDDTQAIPPCDIIYSVQYHQILKKEHIGKASQIAVNLHMAPLPEYRGSNQFSYAIIDGKTEFGTTIHQIDERVDHGDILFQKRFPIPENCWVNDLYQLTFEASVRLFKQTFQHIVEGKYTTITQQSLIHKYGSSLHFRNEIAELKQINLSWDKEKIERHIRATCMPGFEPPYALIDGKKIYFSITPS